MKIVAYMPLSLPSISAKAFKSYVDMISEPILDCQIIPFIHTAFPLDFNRNSAVERILGAYDPDYIMFCDADQVFPRTTIKRLLSEIGDADGISAIYFKKTPPHSCVQGHFLPWDENLEKKRKSLESQDLTSKDGSQLLYYRPLRYFEVVRPIDVFGMGAVLISSNVFKTIKQPYFKYFDPYITQDYTFGQVTEDIWFCGQLKKAGLRIMVDPTIRVGHLCEKIICGNEVEES